MTNYQWVGAVSTSANLAGNWLPSTAVPTTGDVVIFDLSAVDDCVWDIPATSLPTLTVNEIIVESTFTQELSFQTSPAIKGLYLDGTLTTGGGVNKIILQIGASPNYYGTYKSYNERLVLLGDNAVTTGFTFDFYGDTTQITKFDDGPHGTVTLGVGKFAPDYVAPTGTSGKTSFTSLAINDGGGGGVLTFAPDGDLVDNDRLKVFSMEAFTTTQAVLDFGLATAEYYATSGGFNIPTEGATGYPSGFTAYHRKIVLKANTAGHKCLVADNTFISVEEFEIGDGVALKGPVDLDSQGADIRSIQTPKIRGTWSFSQVSQGIYRSPRHAPGPMPKVNGDFHITGKLDVDGLIDPTGLELNPVGSNPGGVTANTLWLNSVDSNKLYHGSSEVGGGSGTVTSVATTAPITGGTITTTGTIGIDAATPLAAGSMSGADKTKLDAIEPSADVTDATNVTAAGALMDSEVTNLAQVKAFDSADYATAAQNGTVTSVATTAPITGGTITGTGTLGLDISALTANTQIADADLLLLDDGANGTNRKVTFDEVAQWIRGEGVLVGRDGGVNKLRIRDSRDDGALTPDDWGNKQVSFDFTDQYQSILPSAYWANVMTFKGWTDSYRVAQLMTSATSEGASGVDTEPLYFRSGEDAGWGAMREVLTFPVGASGSTPNADGTAGQILQTDGANTLSWVDNPMVAETCIINLATDVANFTPTGAYTLLQQTGNWDSSNSNFDDTTGLYTVPSDGVYRISWAVSFRFTSSGQTQASRIYTTTLANPIPAAVAQGQVNTTGNWPVPGGSVLLSLSALDTVGMYVYISNTGKTLVGDSLTVGATQMSINKVSE